MFKLFASLFPHFTVREMAVFLNCVDCKTHFFNILSHDRLGMDFIERKFRIWHTYYICDASRDLAPFFQFKKLKITDRRVLLLDLSLQLY